MPPASTGDAHRAIEAVWRIESARLIAGLARRVGDVGLAEELAQDALVAALEQWPAQGVPENPGAWLMATARNRAIDQIRRDRRLAEKQREIARGLEPAHDAAAALDAAIDDDVGDDLLRLVFAACHPALSTDARVALVLRLLGGLTTEEIARAFLASEATIAQRIVRAKRTLNEKQVAIEVPRGEELVERLASVLEVIYLVFNEGYTATAGKDWTRPDLCEEALRLGRILQGLLPAEPEVHGLAGLMELQASRLWARVGRSGEPVLLLDQNRALWDRLLIQRGLAALERAREAGRALVMARAAAGYAPPQEDAYFAGPYTLQAEIAACHARARTPEETDWRRIVALYGALATIMPSPVVELNRAVAVSMARGPQAALEMVDALAGDPALADYHLLPSVRGDLLEKLGRCEEAVAEYERAASLARNERERDLLLDRARRCSPAR